MSKTWYSIGSSDAEKILKTNAACGLSHKAARSRIKKEGRNDFFYTKEKSLFSLLRALVSDPTFILLVCVDVISALFGEMLAALGIGVVIVVHLASMFVIYRLSCQRLTEISSSCRPKARIIREGKLFVADSEKIARGDIVLLEKGDIVPCDLRLVSSDNLKVNIFTGRNSEKQYVVCEPSADVIYKEGASSEFFEFRNMLYAGSIVVSGNARGIAVETGKRTYIGTLDGGIPLNDGTEHPKTLSELKSFSKVYCLVMLVAILPLTIVGIFSYGFDNILSTFLLSVSVLTSALGDLIYIIGNIVSANILHKCATAEKDRVLIKSSETIDTLAGTEELILVGDSAITDKTMRVSQAFANGKEYKGKEILDKNMIPAAELMTVMMRAVNSYPSQSLLGKVDIPLSFCDYAQRTGADLSTLNLRFFVRSLSFGEINEALVNEGNSAYAVCVSVSNKLLDLCSYEYLNNENVVISKSKREELELFFSSAAKQGGRVYTVAKCINGMYVLYGMFLIKRFTNFEARNTFKKLNSLGIKTTAFIDNLSSFYSLRESGIITDVGEVAIASKDGPSAFEKDRSAYVGYSYSEIKKYINMRRRNGIKVAVYDVRASGYILFKCADISITADSSVKKFPDANPRQIDSYVLSGNDLSDDGSQTLRLFSNVAIPRADIRSGGVASIYNAFLSARNVIKSIIFAISYLLCAQLARASFVIPALVCGAQTVASVYLLIGGLIIDMAMIFALSVSTLDGCQGKFKVPSMKNPFRLCKKELFAIGVSSFVGSICSIIIYFVTRHDVSVAVFASLCLAQILMSLRIKRSVFGKKYGVCRLQLIFIAAIILLAVAFVSVSLLTKSLPLLALVCVPITPILYFALSAFLDFQKEKRA